LKYSNQIELNRAKERKMLQPDCPDQHTSRYTCYRTRYPITIDGNLDKPAWQKAPRSERFVDMVTGTPGLFDTRAAMLWDDAAFYVAFWIEEPFVEAHHTQRDSVIFQENDVEVFIDGGDCYYEFEINALNTIYEVFFIWRDAYRRGSRFDVPEFDLHQPQVYSFGGDYDRQPVSFWRGTHPRGTRWAFLDWDFPGIQTAVQVDGILNDTSSIDKGWTVEIAFPWEGMGWLANGRSLPPKDGDAWRIFLGRFEKLMLSGKEVEPHPAWVMSPHGIYDTHQPQCFPLIKFSDKCVENL
jgi:hypothetical protein